jgi:hypothetical protein
MLRCYVFPKIDYSLTNIKYRIMMKHVKEVTMVSD